nr:ATP-dependent RNA helicase HrpA [Rhizohabitans arisaemae]
MSRDAHRLRRRIGGVRKVRNPAARRSVLAEIAAEVETAEARVAVRRENVPEITYPEALPVSRKRDEILAAIRDHQVVIVAGETGSGKTTQIPKICLELGRGVRGLIGHTQPRRIAARTVAERIAEELKTPLGGVVGYRVRFTDQIGDSTLVKLMTDGILLAELQSDRMLSQYDTLIIDEAHERSLNIDFILGYLKQLLPKRPDLKVIITSATIDPERFSRHFAGFPVVSGDGGRGGRAPRRPRPDHGADAGTANSRPSGRTESAPSAAGPAEPGGGAGTADSRPAACTGSSAEPGETGEAYGGPGGVASAHIGVDGAGTASARLPAGDEAGPVGAPIIEVSGRTYPVEVRYRPITEDQEDQVSAICDAVGELCAEGPGDILVFLSGEREIRDTADALVKQNLRDTEILPLFARLSAADQHRVFQPARGRRIVLATNVAETSLTVPGIKYVIDPGTARISRYSHRLKVQRLPIEKVSQASANQRKGRCGRTSDGVCIRLFDEEDFLSRPEFTDPEILRTNLASVILQMTTLGLGDIAAFPFVEPPDRRQVKDGVLLLQELGAFSGNEVTPLGRKLAQLPVDPRLATMVLAADDNGCAVEVMVIAAALSIQDPRERPADKQEAAQQRHARFADKESDFISYLNLWRYLREQQKELSSGQFRRMCKAEFLNYLRVREWQDIYSQLRQMAKSMGVHLNSTPAEPYRIHVSLLAGLLSHIGLKDTEKHEYQGARNAQFALFPGSALFKKPPRWVMSAELVETSRLWARVNARIEPEWIEPLAGHLVKRTYSEPHWEKKQGAVMAFERVTLYGVPIVAQRKVNYGRIDPELCRDLFIRNALVEGDWDTHHRFLKENRALLDEVAELENRARRRDILVDDETLFDFYDRRIPAEVGSVRDFDVWWKRTRGAQPDLLTFERAMLIQGEGVSEQDYPDVWRQGALRFPLTYQFEPGADADGVTVHIPLAVLNQVSPEGFDWQIPGLREELVTALIKSLPKPIRRNFVPAPNFAKAVLAAAKPREGDLCEVMEREFLRLTGFKIPGGSWDLGRVPDHLRITFRVEDEHRRKIAEDKELGELKRRLTPRLRETLAKAGDGVERRGLRGWSFGRLPDLFEQGRVKGYPALVDERESVAVRVFETREQQRRAMWTGTRRLILLNAPSPVKYVLGTLSNRSKLVLSSHGSAVDLFDDCTACAADKLIADAGGPAWDQEGFARLSERVRSDLSDTVLDVVVKVERILAVAQSVDLLLKGLSSPVLAPSVADVRTQLGALVYPGFVTATGWRRLPDLHRYLRAVERRLEKLPENPQRDREWMAKIAPVRAAFEALPPGEGRTEIRWMLEELRVSYFAQTLGTPHPVSDKRIYRAINQLSS